MQSKSTVCAIILLAFAASGICAFAQQPAAPAEVTPQAAAPAAQPSAPGPPAFGGQRGPKSPEIGADGSVTFRLAAPGATAVTVRGSWQKQREAPLAMAKDESGVWTIKVDALPAELYTYTFSVDGAGMLDPGNVYTMRDGTRYLSALLVPGEASALYEEGDVPHGAIQPQLADEQGALNLAAELLGCQQQSHGDRQIVGRAGLANVGRRQVGGQALHREREAGISHRRAHALLRFLDGGVRQADDLKAGQSLADINFNFDRHALEADHRTAVDFCKHTHSPECDLQDAHTSTAANRKLHVGAQRGD